MSGSGMIAACGLDCGSCSIRRFPFDEAAVAEAIPWYRSQGWLTDAEGVSEAIEKGMICHGCHGDRAAHWSADCWILQCCVDERGLENCSQCPAFPCERLAVWSKTDTSYTEALKRLRARMEDQEAT